ncbi:MAG: YfhO family protein [Lachnospiraceae bacterium]|nr:YfhO family protein [Lachnospiraceae bacterium]
MAKQLNKKSLFPLYASALTLVIYFIILLFGRILGSGNLTILSGDLFSQYTAFIQLFLDVIRGKGNLWYSFSLYLGNPGVSTFAYYCLSPFNLLYLIPGIPFSTMTILLIACKLSLAAAMFDLFLQKTVKCEHTFTILFSVAYALCTFSVTMQIHIMWLDALYILPVLIILICRFVKGKSFLPLILAYIYLFLTNFYMGYIAGLFSAICFIALLALNTPALNKENIFFLLKKTLLYAFSVLLAAGCCAMILVPAAFELFAQRSATGSSFQLVSLTLFDIINNLFCGEMQGLGSPIPLIYCGLPVLYLLPLYFSGRNIPKKEKIAAAAILLFYLLGMLFKPLYSFLHAFEAPNWYAHRYAFCIVFLLLTLACRALSERSVLTIKKAGIYSCILLVFYSVMITFQSVRFGGSYSTNTQDWFLVNALFVGIYFILYVLSFKKEKHSKAVRILSVLTTLTLSAELLVNGVYCLSGNSFGFFSEADISAWENTEISGLGSIQPPSNDFYRIRINGERNFNAPSFYHYPGLNTFSTVDNAKLRSTLSSLGIATSFMTIYDHGYTPLMDMLFGVRYSVDPAGEETPLSVSYNSYALPLGFMVNPNLIAYRGGDDPFMNQQNLLTALSDTDDVFYIPVDLSEAEFSYENMNMLTFDIGYIFQHLSDISSNGTVTISFPEQKGKTIFACFSTGEESTLIGSAPEVISNPQGYDKAYQLSDGAIVSAIPNEDGIPQFTLVFKAGNYYDYMLTDMKFYAYDDSALPKMYEKLSSHSFHITEWHDGEIFGNVTVEGDEQILFTSIPYDKGWDVFVDDIPVRTLVSVDGTFLALFLSHGTHSIRFSYNPPSLLVASGITAGCLSLYLILLLIAYHRWQNKNKKNTRKETTVPQEEDHEKSPA